MAESNNTATVKKNQNHGSRSRSTSRRVKSKPLRVATIPDGFVGIVFVSIFQK